MLFMTLIFAGTGFIQGKNWLIILETSFEDGAMWAVKAATALNTQIVKTKTNRYEKV
jgi:hypothetical protein